MAIEVARGCGYRKVGGLYLVSVPCGVSCDRFPITLPTVCPTCGGGIKPTRGWTWVMPYNILGGDHIPCRDSKICPVCHPLKMGRRAGLIWVGSNFYPTANDFLSESNTLGISKRISNIPVGLVLGKTWILVGHRQGAPATESQRVLNPELERVPGLFMAFIPERVEKIITETESKNTELVAKLHRRGITPVVVPDNDPDHQRKKSHGN